MSVIALHMACALLVLAAEEPKTPKQAVLGPEVSPREYEIYAAWRESHQQSDWEKYDETTKRANVAQLLEIPTKELDAVVGKLEILMPTLKKHTEKAIQANLKNTPLASRVLTVELNLDAKMAVAWVAWQCKDLRDLDKEAAYVAWAVAQGGPVVSVVGLWCTDPKGTKLFSAKIGRPAMGCIKKDAIERFGCTRYIKLFESVIHGVHQ